MRAGARPRKGSQSDRAERWSRRWLVVAAIVFGAAVVYLYLSISEATTTRHAGDITGESAAGPGEPAPAAASSSVTTPGPSPTPKATPTPRPTPLPLPQRGTFPVAPREDPALLSAIEEAVDGQDEHIAVAVKRLKDGRSASFNADREYYAASTFKLAVLYEASRRHAVGELFYDDTLVLTDQDLAEDLGTSSLLDVADDGTISIENLLRPMIVFSDNVSAVALLHYLGSSKVDETLRALGIETMTVNNTDLVTTAGDLALLMEAIYGGEGVGDAERDGMRGWLLDSTWRQGIPGELRGEVAGGLKIGNKTGTWVSAQHDVAFIEAQNGAFILSILTDGSLEGWEAMHRVTRAVYEAMLAR